MKHICVNWNHSHDDAPVLLYSELDADRYETRKVEVFRDGHTDYADEQSTTGSTFLSVEPIPPLTTIAEDPQFEPREISPQEFERVWIEATRSN